MQTVYCLVRNCGYCGSNGFCLNRLTVINEQDGFCLNRLTVINEQGVCKYLTKPGWENKVDEKWFNNRDAATLIESNNEASDDDKKVSSEQEA